LWERSGDGNTEAGKKRQGGSKKKETLARFNRKTKKRMGKGKKMKKNPQYSFKKAFKRGSITVRRSPCD